MSKTMHRCFSNRLLILIVAIAFLGITFACLFFASRASSGNLKNTPDDLKETIDSYYLFDPNTILESLAQGTAVVFLPQPTGFEPTLVVPAITVKWQQDDYVDIASALHTQFWNETIQDWKLHFMVFHADCQHIDQGPQKVTFEFYKITSSLFRKRGYEQTIMIDPSTSSIWLKNENLSSQGVYKHSIALSRLNVFVEDAFRIAENNGGREARMRVQNNCSVSAVLAPDGSAQNWMVNYFNKDSAHLFNIAIDEYTGEYKVIHP